MNTRLVDARAFYEQYVTLAGKPTRVWRTGEYEYHSNCPWCGGHNRFAFWSSGRYSCALRASGCGRFGRDVIDFLRAYEGLSFVEACEELGIDPDRNGERPTPSAITGEDELPSKKWQERAAIIIHQAQRFLWSKRGHQALLYLRQRGFTDSTIRAAELGYIPLTSDGRWYKDSVEPWGLSEEESQGEGVWLPEGILIPWYADGVIWKLNVRRLTGLRKGDAKYVQMTGSREGLYHVDTIRLDEPLVLCESELDALSGQQICADLAAFVATGATARARRNRWLARMGLASCVLVTYDDDHPDRNGKRAGDEGAVYWLSSLPHALRWLPWAHDVNEMLQQGHDIRSWVMIGREVARTTMNAVQELTVSESGMLPDEHGRAFCIKQDQQRQHDQNGEFPEHLLSSRVINDTTRQDQSMVLSVSALSAVHGENLAPRISTPTTLPALPRTHCPFELVVVGKDQHIKARKCRGKTLPNGWCEMHQHAQEVLDLGARLGYPRLDLTPHRAVGEGKGCWEAYAIRAPQKWLITDLPRMKTLLAQR